MSAGRTHPWGGNTSLLMPDNTYQHRYLGLTTAQLGSAQHQIMMILHTDFLELCNVHLKLPLVPSDKRTSHGILV